MGDSGGKEESAKMGGLRIGAGALGAVLLAGCYGATGPVTRPISELRTMKRGVCAEVAIDSAALTFVSEGRERRRIDTCLQTGLPGTLMDDGKTPLIHTMINGGANSPDADADNWQVEVSFNGVPVAKRMMSKSSLVPELSCDTSGCESWSTDLMQWSQPFGPGTYVFKYTFALDTSRVFTNTITLEGPSADPALTHGTPSVVSPAAPAPTGGSGPKLGIRMLPTPLAVATKLQLDKARGMTVVIVDQGSVAATAGIRPGDVILECNDQPTDTVEQLHAVLAAASPGALVRCKLWSVTGAEGDKPVFGERIVSMTWTAP